jgi:hypothetical protein
MTFPKCSAPVYSFIVQTYCTYTDTDILMDRHTGGQTDRYRQPDSRQTGSKTHRKTTYRQKDSQTDRL